MQSQQKLFGWPSALLVALSIMPFAYAALFTFPNGDDFAAALKARHLFDVIGGVDAMFSAWWKWSGRYSYHFLQIFFGDVANHRPLYSLFLLLSFGLFWLSAFGIARELGKNNDRGQAAFCATLWLAAMLCTHGFLSGWYLLVELLTLTGGHCLTLVYTWSLCRLWNRPVATRGTKCFCIISGVMASGMYEYSALMVLMISFAAWVLARIYSHVHTRIFFFLFTVAGACFLISYLARGNFRRQTKRSVTLALMLEQLAQVGGVWLRHVVPHFANPVFFVGALLAGWFVPGWKTPLTSKIPAPLILLAGAGATCAFTLALTIVLALSDVTVDEALKLPTQMIQYTTIFVMFSLLACRDTLRLDSVRRMGRPLGLAVFIALLLGGNTNFFPVLWNGLSGSYKGYEAAHKNRVAFLAANAGKPVTVMPLTGAPFPLSADILEPQPKSWPNKYAGPFYGVPALGTAKTAPEEALHAAKERGMPAWKPAGSKVALAFAPALSPGRNATYDCGWLFVASGAPTAPTVRLLTLPHSPFTALPKSVQARAFVGLWPFQGLIQTVPLAPVPEANGTIYAAPLPFGEGTSLGARLVFVSVDGEAFVPLVKDISRGE